MLSLVTFTAGGDDYLDIGHGVRDRRAVTPSIERHDYAAATLDLTLFVR